MRFGFWDVFWILGSVLDSGKCFGFWEVFRILGSVFGFWEVFWHSRKCFGILGSVLSLWATVVRCSECTLKLVVKRSCAGT